MASVIDVSMRESVSLLGSGLLPLQSSGFELGLPGLVAILLLATASTLVVTRLGHRPREKRTYLFETDDGERVNPFADFSEGAARSAELCDGCGTVQVPRSFRYCAQCVSTGVRDE